MKLAKYTLYRGLKTTAAKKKAASKSLRQPPSISGGHPKLSAPLIIDAVLHKVNIQLPFL